MATIYRGPLPSDDYAPIANAWLRDKTLSWKARGLLAYLASHKTGFEVSLSRLEKASERDGREAARTAIQELEERGYLTRSKDRDDKGRISGVSYTLTDPIVAKPDVGETRRRENPAVGEADGGGTRTHKKTSSSKKTTDAEDELPTPPPASADEVFEGEIFEGEIAPPLSTQTLIAEWLDHCTEKPPGQVIGQLSKTVKRMLDEGITYERVRNGVAEWHQRGLHPSTLPAIVHELSTPQKRNHRPSRQQETESTLDAAMRRAQETEQALKELTA